MSGAGKSTLAAALAARLDVAHTELDALFWGPSWEPSAPSDFRDAVDHAAGAAGWVIDGNYSLVRPLVWPRADAIVWLNLPFALVFGRVFARTARRVFRRELLWGTNRESLFRTFFHHESILWWVLSAYRRRRRQMSALMGSPDYPHAKWLEMRRAPRDADEVLARLEAMQPGTHEVVA